MANLTAYAVKSRVNSGCGEKRRRREQNAEFSRVPWEGSDVRGLASGRPRTLRCGPSIPPTHEPPETTLISNDLKKEVQGRNLRNFVNRGISPSGRESMIRSGSRNVLMNRIKASSARQRLGLRVAQGRRIKIVMMGGKGVDLGGVG